MGAASSSRVCLSGQNWKMTRTQEGTSAAWPRLEKNGRGDPGPSSVKVLQLAGPGPPASKIGLKQMPIGALTVAGTLRVRVFLFLSLGLALPSSAAAQTVEGRILDAQTGEPVRAGVIRLRSSLGSVVNQTESDSLGAYALTAPSPGLYSLHVTALGYRSTPTLQFDVGWEAPTRIDVRLDPEPIELDSLAVKAEGRQIIPHLEGQGFYKREEEGFGQFITPEEIEQRNPRNFHDLLRSIPGLRVNQAGIERWPPRCGYGDGKIWLDGILMDDRAPLSQYLSIDEIQAVEVYIGVARVPLQYGGLGGECVILIWTKGSLR